MKQYRIAFQSGQTSFKAKLLIFSTLILGFALLSMFAMSFIAIAILSGLAIIIMRLFQGNKDKFSEHTHAAPMPLPKYKIPTRHDNDVIDI